MSTTTLAFVLRKTRVSLLCLSLLFFFLGFCTSLSSAVRLREDLTTDLSHRIQQERVDVEQAMNNVDQALSRKDDVLQPVPLYEKETVEDVIASAQEILPSGDAEVQPIAVIAPSGGPASFLETMAKAQIKAGDRRAVVPPFEDLPSMAPQDGLEGDGFGPLIDPHPFPGERLLPPTHHMSASSLPPASSLVPPYLGSDLPMNDIRFVAAGAASLPPLMGPPGTTTTPLGMTHAAMLSTERVVRNLVLPEPSGRLIDPEAMDLDAFGQPRAATSLPALYPGGLPIPPSQPSLPHVPSMSQTTLPNMDLLPFAASALMNLNDHPHTLPLSADPVYKSYSELRESQIHRRQRLLHEMNERKKAIDQLQQVVESGQTWLTQKETQLQHWIKDERSRMAHTVSHEANQIMTLRQQLEKLTHEQYEAEHHVNSLNTDLQKSAIQYQLSLQKDQAKLSEENEKRLKEELDRVAKEGGGEGSHSGSHHEGSHSESSG